MPRQKRTAEELRIAILEKIKEMEDNADENDINKTAIANAIGINNTLATSLLDGLTRDRLILRDGFGRYAMTLAGKGWLSVERMGKEKAGLFILRIMRRNRDGTNREEQDDELVE